MSNTALTANKQLTASHGEIANELTGEGFAALWRGHFCFPMSEMDEALYINGVLVSCPVKGPTLQLATNI